MSAKSDELVGRRVLGRYRITQVLAEGGMGVVYIGRGEGAAGFTKPVVIKKIKGGIAESADAQKMFIREARILSYLRHPNIVNVVDFGEQDGSLLMVLEYVHGFNLGEWYRYLLMTRRRFPVTVGLYAAIQVLDALEHAHNAVRTDGRKLHIVHRDVSPTNVLIDTAGHVKLADFGVARAPGVTDEFQTAAGIVKGKLPYLAPELLEGAQPNQVTDVYAASLLLHEVLVGKNEFYAQDMASTMAKVHGHTPSLVSHVRPEAPKILDEILSRALAKRPEQRFQSAGALASELRRASGLSEDEAAEALLLQVRQDFHDEMADVLGISSLAQRDRAWREELTGDSVPPERRATAGAVADVAPSVSAPLRPTAAPKARAKKAVAPVPNVVMPPPARVPVDVAVGGDVDASERESIPPVSLSAAPPATDAQPEKRSGVQPLLSFVAGVAAAAALGGVGWFAMTAENAPVEPMASAPKIAQEDAAAEPLELRLPSPSPEPSEDVAQQSPEDDSGESIEAEPERGAPAAARAPSTPKPKARALTPGEFTRAMSKKASAFRQCYQKNIASGATATDFSLQVTVGTSGRAEDVVLAPANAASSPLGRCIGNVAKSVRFPRQPAQVTFRIPIRANVRRDG